MSLSGRLVKPEGGKAPDEERVRTLLARELRREVPDGVWAILLGFEVVQTAIEAWSEGELGFEEAFEALVESARSVLREWPGDGSAARRPAPDRQDAARAAAQEEVARQWGWVCARCQEHSRYLGRRAGESVWVRGCRSALFDGRVLTPDEAWKLLDSPAPRFLPMRTFRERGIPLVGHRASLPKEPKGEYSDEGTTLRGDLVIGWEDGACVVPFESRVLDAVSAHNQGGMPFQLMAPGRPADMAQVLGAVLRGEAPPPPPRPRPISVCSGSVFARLATDSKHLAEQYPWKEHEATWFLLTGEAPIVDAWGFDFPSRHTPDHSFPLVQLTVAPWMPAELVARLYRFAQRAALDREDAPPMNERRVRLFGFLVQEGVWGNLHDPQRKPKWTELMGRWNAAHPEWTYAPGAFRKACLKAWVEIAFGGRMSPVRNAPEIPPSVLQEWRKRSAALSRGPRDDLSGGGNPGADR